MDNEVDKFLEGLNDEPKSDPFEQSKEDPFEAEEAEEKAEEKEEKPLPFHKDPKVQKFIDKEISKRMADMKPVEADKPVKESASEDSLTDVLTRIIGNDTPEKLSAIKEFRRELGTLEEKGAQKALKELEDRSSKERQKEEEAERELVEAIDAIEESFEVDLTSNTPAAKKMKDDFFKFVTRVSRKDQNGQVIEYPDFQETFSLFKETSKPQANNKAKELSSRSMSRSTDASKPADTGDRSWRAVDKLFSNLRN